MKNHLRNAVAKTFSNAQIELTEEEIFAIYCAKTFGFAVNEYWLKRLTSDDESERIKAAEEILNIFKKH